MNLSGEIIETKETYFPIVCISYKKINNNLIHFNNNRFFLYGFNITFNGEINLISFNEVIFILP